MQGNKAREQRFSLGKKWSQEETQEGQSWVSSIGTRTEFPREFLPPERTARRWDGNKGPEKKEGAERCTFIERRTKNRQQVTAVVVKRSG